MNRKNLIKVSIISFAISVFSLAFDYFFFHYFTDEGFSNVFNEEAQKPFVADLIGQLGVLFLFFAIAILLIAFICYPKEENK